MSYFNKEREECIELLLNLGAEDLTHVRHPNKQGKKYLKLRIKNLNSYITFNFDYSEYKEASVWATRRSKPRAYMKFKDIKPMLIDMGLVWCPHLSHFLLIKTYIGCLNGGICAVKSQFSNFG